MLPLVMAVMWIFILPKPNIVVTENAFPLFYKILGPIKSFRGLLIFLALLSTIIQAFYLTSIINRHSALKETSHLPALLFVVMMSCFPEQLSFNPLIIANFFIIAFLNYVFNLYRAEKAVFSSFDAGFFIGMAAMFYWPALFLFPLIWAALLILRSFEWREWIASLFGVLLPFVFFSATLFWFDMFSFDSIKSIFEPFTQVQISAVYNSTYFILFGILLFIVIASLVRFSKDLGTFSKLRTRKFLTLLVWFFIFAALSYLMSKKSTMVSLSFLAIPLAVLISNYFLSIKKVLFAESLFLILIIAVIYNQVLFFLHYFPV